MSLYHGTSAGKVLHILEAGKILPSADGFFYCFNSDKPESAAGALCFATGGDLRPGSIKRKDLLDRYMSLNPDFPTGTKGAFIKAALNITINAWIKEQKKQETGGYDSFPAILVYKPHPDAIDRKRGGFINEVIISAESLPTLSLECVYIDDALMNDPVFTVLAKKGAPIKPISAFVARVFPDANPGFNPKAPGAS